MSFDLPLRDDDARWVSGVDGLACLLVGTPLHPRASCDGIGRALGIEPAVRRFLLVSHGWRFRPGDVKRIDTDITKARELLGHQPETPIGRWKPGSSHWSLVLENAQRGRVTSNERPRFHKLERNA